VRNPARTKSNSNATKDPSPPTHFCQVKSTKEKHVEDTGYEETDKESTAKNPQGKEGGEARKEVGLIRWRAKAIQPGLGPVLND
jgi:hypothetical protein